MRKIVYIGILLLLISCERQVEINVTCVDSQTLQPLEGVEVRVNAGLDGDYNKSTTSGITDSVGNFKDNIMIGCPSTCYDIYITYNKPGYDEKVNLNETDGQVKLHTSSWSD